MKRNIRNPLLIGCLICMLSMSACFSPTSAPPSPASESGASSATSDLPGSETSASEPAVSNEGRKLVIWDGQTESVGNLLYQSFVDGFSAETGIEVERIPIKVEDLRNTIKPAINSGEGPDVFTYDPGAGYLGVLASSGLALDVTGEANARGWYDRHMDWTLNQCTFGGKLYGIGNQVEALGVFYNKELFEAHGVTVPETYDEFLAACETFKSAGVLPLMIDDLDQWPGFHLESLWLNAFVGPQAVTDVLALKAGWDQPEFGAAMDELYRLVTAGYTPPTPNAISYDDANNQFMSGQAAMRPTGGWQIGAYSDPEMSLIAEQCGFFFLPSANGMPTSAPGGIGEAMVINGRTQNADIALDYLDYIFTGDRIQAWYEGAYIPSVEGIDLSSFDLPPLFKAYAEELLGSENMGYNIDVLMPAKVNDLTQNIMQELLAGKRDGAAYMQDKQAAYQEEVDAGNYEAIA